MTTADILEPFKEQTIAGMAEVIVRSWRVPTMMGLSTAHYDVDPASAARGRENSRKVPKKKGKGWRYGFNA